MTQSRPGGPLKAFAGMGKHTQPKADDLWP